MSGPPILWLSRVAAVLLAASFSLSAGEPLIPEYHDGDASTSVAVADAPVAPHDSVPQRDHSPGAAHICHCIHMHGLSVTEVAVQAPAARPRTAALALRVAMPASLERQPSLRPPIA